MPVINICVLLEIISNSPRLNAEINPSCRDFTYEHLPLQAAHYSLLTLTTDLSDKKINSSRAQGQNSVPNLIIYIR